MRTITPEIENRWRAALLAALRIPGADNALEITDAFRALNARSPIACKRVGRALANARAGHLDHLNVSETDRILILSVIGDIGGTGPNQPNSYRFK